MRISSVKKGTVWVGIACVLAGLASVPAGAREMAPIWQQGDWWIVAEMQRAVWMRVDNPPWVQAGRHRFEVEEVSGEGVRARYRLSVQDLEPARAGETVSLDLVYSAELELSSGEYRVGDRKLDLPRALRSHPFRAGGFNVASRAARRLSEDEESGRGRIEQMTDERTGEQVILHRIDLIESREIQETTGALITQVSADEEYQLWRTGEPWPRVYRRTVELPIELRLVDCSCWER